MALFANFEQLARAGQRGIAGRARATGPPLHPLGCGGAPQGAGRGGRGSFGKRGLSPFRRGPAGETIPVSSRGQTVRREVPSWPGKRRGGSGPKAREGPWLGLVGPRGVGPDNSLRPRGPTRLATETPSSPPVT